MRLEFTDISRSTTRTEWREIHRWLRLVSRELEHRMQPLRQAFADLMTYGSSVI